MFSGLIVTCKWCASRKIPDVIQLTKPFPTAVSKSFDREKVHTIDQLKQKSVVIIVKAFLPARRYASAGYSDRNVSVRLSVCLSVCPFVTRRYCVKTKKASVMISSPSGSPKTLVF